MFSRVSDGHLVDRVHAQGNVDIETDNLENVDTHMLYLSIGAN